MTRRMSGPPRLESPNPRAERLDTDSRVGTVLAERYRIDSLLGEGGMGRVYAAEHVLMRKRLAVKVLHRELTTVPEVVARFEREAMAAANIDHPNVAAATDFGKLVDGAVFLVLEYVQGRNLRDEIAAGPLPLERALHIGRQIASALASAHALDIVHRDLKPENVMLVEKAADPDFVKVLDFGIAKVPIGETQDGSSGKPITKVGMVFGTPEYMAPEQALGQAVDGRADLYALGVILYEMLAGIRPFSSKSQVGILGQQLSKPPPRFAERAPGIAIPPQVEQLTLKLLAKEAGDRFQSAEETVAGFDAMLGGPPARGQRMFTLAGGSPSAFGSSPGTDSVPGQNLAAIAGGPASVPDGLVSIPDVPASILDPVSGSIPLSTAPLDSAAPASGLAAAGAPPSNPDASGPWSETSIPIAGAGSVPDGISSPNASGALPAQRATSNGASFLAPLVQPRPGTLLDRVYRWIEDRIDALPDGARAPLRDVPTPAFLAGGVLLVLGGFVALVLVVAAVASGGRSPSTSPSAAIGSPATRASALPPGSRAPEQELATARKAGSAALVKLAAQYPKDPAVQLELAKAYLLERRHSDAVAVIGRLLSADPEMNTNPDVASTLWMGAQAKSSSDAAFTLLEGPMGAKGADIIYDLVMTKGVSWGVKRRAEHWLHGKAFQQNASPALNVAVALRFANNCPERYALLLHAKDVGDKRSLHYIRQYESRSGCGRRHRQDCYFCMRKDDRLKQTIEAIEKRDHG